MRKRRFLLLFFYSGIALAFLAALLAFLLGATLLAVTSAPAEGQEVTHVFAALFSQAGTIHGDGDNNDATEEVATLDNIHVEIDDGATIVMRFLGDTYAIDGEGPDIRIHTVNEFQPNEANISVSEDGETWLDVGDGPLPDWQTVDDGVFGVDIDLSGLEGIDRVKFVRLVGNDQGEGEFEENDGTPGFDLDAVEALNFADFPPDETVIPCGEGGDACSSFEDPDGNWQASCEGCEGATIIIREEDPEIGEVANIEVTGEEFKADDGFTLELTSARPDRWWRASVFVSEDDGDPQPMDRCTLREIARWLLRQQRPGEGCFYLTPLFGNRLRYTVLWPTDPGFSFR
jgi:hypothetical protein